MGNPNLYVIGTVHIDLDGRERLDTMLSNLSPEIIALEMSKDREEPEKQKEFSEKDIEEMDKLIEKTGIKLNPGQREALIESSRVLSSVIGFELAAVKDYTSKNGTRLEYIDISVFTNGKKEFVKGYIEYMKTSIEQIAQESELSKLFLEKLDKGTEAYLQHIREGTQLMYQNAELMGMFLEFVRDQEITEEMEKELPPQAVQSLKQIINPERDKAMAKRIRELYDGNRRLVAITGLGHIHGIKPKIADLEPKILTLADYNSAQVIKNV